ncbi:fibrinogen C domain-containing protein 1-like [Strongylocentrotus purpuratus]|uniref:Fibrinogen C-terminal domain-containing protein n=1 Tax=Strongylocentrotus purpuratus TaxID=7668 RepID=A0A7M7N8Y2_STRPU|nr:fibrinogen C domain-containing protein 1-like [Strongylocentrotus purpuratus]
MAGGGHPDASRMVGGGHPDASRMVGGDHPDASMMVGGGHPDASMMAGGGHPALMRKRYDGSVNFYRNYSEYVQGFGDVSGEYWLGLDIIHLLSKGGVELRVDMVDYGNIQLYAHYGQFSIGSPITKYDYIQANLFITCPSFQCSYQLDFASYSGNAGEALYIGKNRGFSTYDMDNDNSNSNCAIVYRGAWWYGDCYSSNLNGVYGIYEVPGIAWNYMYESIFMKSTEMKLRESS